MAAPDWMPPAGDVVPTTDAELAPFVAQLTDAMKDMSQFRDNINTKLKKRWLDATIQRSGQPGAVLSNNFYMPHVLEALAWKIAVRTFRAETVRNANTPLDHDPKTPPQRSRHNPVPGSSHSRELLRRQASDL